MSIRVDSKFAGCVLIAVLAACSPNRETAIPGANFAPAIRMQPASMTISGTYATGIDLNASANGIAAGPDGRLWFAEFNVSKIGAITTNGKVTEYATTFVNAQPNAMIDDPSRARLWTGGYGGAIIKIATTGAQKNYPAPGAHTGDMIVGPDRNIWFTDYGNVKVGRLKPAASVVEFALPAKANPVGIAVGKDGNIWIADGGNHSIIKMNTAGAIIKSFKTGISTGEEPQFIVAAPDGNLYFTEWAENSKINDKIGRITTTGKITEIGSLRPNSFPGRLAVGKDSNVYFVSNSRRIIGKIVIANSNVFTVSLPFANDHATFGIAKGPGGRLWVTGFHTIYAISY